MDLEQLLHTQLPCTTTASAPPRRVKCTSELECKKGDIKAQLSSDISKMGKRKDGELKQQNFEVNVLGHRRPVEGFPK